MFAGWRSGLVALLLGQALVWIFVLEPHGRLEAKDSADAGGLIVATVAQLIVLAITTLYQREVDRGSARSDSEMDLMQKALAEIDHRTVNNYQAVQSLILAQAKATDDKPARESLQKIADRIKAIANASRRLASSSESLEKVRPDEHLQELCAQIEKGLARPGVRLECEFADVTLDPNETTAMSMLVNELVTNALKHAFPDGREGVVRVGLGPIVGGLELSVEDNGIGLTQKRRTRSTGLGTRLVETFVKQLHGKHEVASNENGTRHRIRIPVSGRARRA